MACCLACCLALGFPDTRTGWPPWLLPLPDCPGLLALSGWRRNRWRRRGSRHGTIFISTPGRAAKCHKKMETQVIVIVLFLTYPPQPAASSTHPHSEKINKTCLLNTSEIALFMARGRRREVGGGVEVKQEVRTAEAVTGVN